jgi:hypothetical protein
MKAIEVRPAVQRGVAVPPRVAAAAQVSPAQAILQR